MIPPLVGSVLYQSQKTVNSLPMHPMISFILIFFHALKEGRYKKRSISLTPEGKLRHIGFLGAAKPAVKGLADIQFTSPSSEVYEFDFEKESEVEIVNEEHKPEIEIELNIPFSLRK